MTNGQEREVAIFVRRSIEAESPESPVSLGALVQKLADALLLTIPAMLKARIRISQDEVAQRRATQVVLTEAPKLSARERAKKLGA